MTRHIADHARSADSGQMLKALIDARRRLDEAGPHPSTLILQRRSRKRTEPDGDASGTRTRAFTRIERGAV